MYKGPIILPIPGMLDCVAMVVQLLGMGIFGKPNSSTSTPSLFVAIEAAPGSLGRHSFRYFSPSVTLEETE